MIKPYLKYLILVLGMTFTSQFCYGQQAVDSNYAIFDGDSAFYILHPPDDWTLALEEAQLDGYSAGFYPDSSLYATSNVVINAWIFKNNNLKFEKFIEADTLNYIDADDRFKITETDTLSINEKLKIIIFNFNDPGGWSSLAAVAYIDAVAEIVIYELHISNRDQFIEADSKFREALGKFSISAGNTRR